MDQTAADVYKQITGKTWSAPQPTPAMLGDRGDNRTNILNSLGTKILGSVAPGVMTNPNTTPASLAQAVTNNNPAPSNNNGFDMKYYPGWDPASALADWKATGGSKAAGFGSSSGFTSPEGNSYGSQEEYNRLIDESYNPQISALNEQAGNLNMSQDSALKQAQDAFNTQQGLAQGQLTTAQNSLTDVATKGQSAYESALAQARQVYDQLQRGYQQRFGGATSAGQAATEIGNVERLKQQGQSYKQLQDVNRQVEMGKVDVQKQYDNNILQLQQNKDQAIASVQSEFRDKLAQINASKGMVESAKAGAKLQALQALRAQVLQVQQQETSFKQQLEMQKQQAQIQLDTYAKQLAMSQSGTTNNAQTGIDQMLTKPTPTATVSTGQTNSTYAPTGQISTSNRFGLDWINGGMA